MILLKKSLFLLLIVLATQFDLGQAQSQEKTRIACVGDSITFGASIKNREKRSYPAQLAEMLGEKYHVKNFGRNGATLLKKGDLPYYKQSQFKNALEFKPNIVVIKLGTNDTKPQNWGKHSSDYGPDYIWLIEQFAKLPSKPKIYVCLPVPVAKDRWGIRESIVKEQVIPAINELAKKTESTIIDLYEPFNGKHALIHDGVHPNGEGATVIAKSVFKAISSKTTSKKK